MKLTLKDLRKKIIWEKAYPLPGFDPNIYRIDEYGDIIKYSDHGNRDSEFGWEIDHEIPVSLIRIDNISNLKPLHYRNNIAKSNNIFRSK